MVSRASDGPGSRPAPLTQAQVDDLVRGDHAGVAEVRRTASPALSSAERGVDVAGGASRPADLSPKEIDAIRRSGHPSAAVTKRVATVERVDARPAAESGRSKAAKRRGAPTAPTAPTARPPGDE